MRGSVHNEQNHILLLAEADLCMVNEDQVTKRVSSESADAAASRTSVLGLAMFALFEHHVILVIDFFWKLER